MIQTILIPTPVQTVDPGATSTFLIVLPVILMLVMVGLALIGMGRR